MTSRWLILPLATIAAAAMLRAANNDTPDADEPQNDSKDTPRAKHVPPLIKWTFDADEPGTWSGKKSIDAQGPQKPMYPAFPAGNKAANFTGKDSFITVKETDLPPGVSLRFGHGDAITLEAWVNPEELRDGSYCYLIGKGRNKAKGFEPENQNWALRLKGDNGEARPAFLFRTVAEKFDSQKDYHRWVANEGFSPNSGWHHVAVTFKFGDGNSLRCYLDGKELKGTWDMGGKSDLPPINDADDVVIGTGNGGGAGNSLMGWLDEVAVYREVLPETVFAQRYQFIPPPPPVDVTKLVPGKVLVQICDENVPAKNAWPALPPAATETYTEKAFGLVEIPHKYVDTGVRGDRPIPFVLRAAAKVTLPPGKHRLLLRGRGSAHLHVDGKQVLNTPFPKPDTGGHGYLKEQEGWLDLGPDFRFAPPGTQEAWCEYESDGREHVFIMETMVGGVAGKSRRRPELGETVVAWSRAGSETWELLTPAKKGIPYNDAAWTAYDAAQREQLVATNAANRARQRALHAAYWDKRRKSAAQWLASTTDVKVPGLAKGYPAGNEVDRFIAAKMAAVAEQNDAAHKGTVDFFRDVLPILETKCFDCHKGGKAKGDLKLDSLADALKGGESDGAAITPKHPDKSSLLARVTTDDVESIMPPKGEPLSKDQIATLTKWITEGASWPEIKADNMTVTALTDDLSFLRRITLDTVGVVPTLAEIETFTKDTSKDRRAKAIDRLLKDPRWADNWMGYWQDVLAENPNILNPTLNNTGPFRWWIHESLLDNKPMDLFVTELLRMKGSERFGGPAGFSAASQNDVPMAAKGTIVSTAFLGVEMKCARCHDSPAHLSTQEDLFSLAAMLGKKELEVPMTSSVAADKLSQGGRKPLIQVTLKPGSKVQPKWPFSEFCPEPVADTLAEDATDSRDRLAALVTAPQNERFAQVITNRVWKRFMGRGIVEPVDDWEKGKPTHPELLNWLARDFVRSGYDVKHLARVIMNSHAYQRATDSTLKEASPLYASPAPRRLTAEQIVDSLFTATGKPFRTEEVSLDIDGRRDLANSISLGNPNRSWMLASTSNERDRPSLALPRVQAVCDVLAAFGWRGARQDPTSVREIAPNALQPAIMSNGTMSVWLTRLSDDHGITQLALEEQTVEQLVDTLYLRLLTRRPTDEERSRGIEHLTPGFDTRLVNPSNLNSPPSTPSERRPEKYVTWSNHLDPEATLMRQEQEHAARRGDPPTTRLDAEWRQRLEDVLWALLNAPEWVFTP